MTACAISPFNGRNKLAAPSVSFQTKGTRTTEEWLLGQVSSLLRRVWQAFPFLIACFTIRHSRGLGL